jgi:hypothetical protein
MLSKAVEWGMLDQNPFDNGRSLQRKENNKGLRYLSEDEIGKQLAACPDPASPKIRRKKTGLFQGTQAVHLKDFVLIAVNTGNEKGGDFRS